MKLFKQIFLFSLILSFGLLCGCSNDTLDEPNNSTTIYSISGSEFEEQVAGKMWVSERQFFINEFGDSSPYIPTGYEAFGISAFTCDGSEMKRYFRSCEQVPDVFVHTNYIYSFDEATGYLTILDLANIERQKIQIESLEGDVLTVRKYHGMGWYYEDESGNAVYSENKDNFVQCAFHIATPEEVEKFSSWPLYPPGR